MHRSIPFEKSCTCYYSRHAARYREVGMMLAWGVTYYKSLNSQACDDHCKAIPKMSQKQVLCPCSKTAWLSAREHHEIPAAGVATCYDRSHQERVLHEVWTSTYATEVISYGIAIERSRPGASERASERESEQVGERHRIICLIGLRCVATSCDIEGWRSNQLWSTCYVHSHSSSSRPFPGNRSRKPFGGFPTPRLRSTRRQTSTLSQTSTLTRAFLPHY